MGLKTYEHTGKKIYNPALSRSRLLITSETGCKIGFGEGATASQKLPARKPVFFKKGAESSFTIDGDCTVSTDGSMEVGTAFRNVLNLNGVSQYAVAPRIDEIDLDDPNLEFEIEWTGVATRTGAIFVSQSVSFSSAGREFVIFIAGNGKVGLIMGGKQASVTLQPYPLNIKTTAALKYKNGLVTLTYNDISDVTPLQIGDAREPSAEFLIGARRNGSDTSAEALYQGKFHDIKIWTGGDRNTGTLTRWYEMVEGWRGTNNQVLVNSATELGAELIINGDFSEGLDGWVVNETPPTSSVTIANGEARLWGEGVSNVQLSQSLNLTSDTNCLLEMSKVSVSNDVLLGTGASAKSIPEGVSSTIRKSDATLLFGRKYSEGSPYTEVLIDNVSVRQADGYGTYIGFTEASWTEEEV